MSRVKYLREWCPPADHLLDMKSQGVTIGPIITIDGHHHLNQVFFDNVRVPVENLVGEEGGGWTVAKQVHPHACGERLAFSFFN